MDMTVTSQAILVRVTVHQLGMAAMEDLPTGARPQAVVGTGTLGRGVALVPAQAVEVVDLVVWVSVVGRAARGARDLSSVE